MVTVGKVPQLFDQEPRAAGVALELDPVLSQQRRQASNTNEFIDGIRDRVQIHYFTRDPEPTGEAHDPVVWMDAESRRRKIDIHYEFVVRSIDPVKKQINGLYNYSLPYDLLVMVPPHRPAQVLLDCGLAEVETGIRVDYDTLQTKWENVFAIGDCADMPASKAGGVAHQEADVLAHNLAVEITGKGRPVDLWLHTI